MARRIGSVKWIVLAGIASAFLLVMAFRDHLGLNRSVHAQEGAAPVEKTKQEGNPEKDEQASALSKFMRQKLNASNQILEGLCTEDLTMVQDGAKVLTRMSHEERWRVSSDMMYRRYSNEFIASVDELQKDAEANDLNKASLAWVNVTMKCLKCHEWVRNTVIAEK